MNIETGTLFTETIKPFAVEKELFIAEVAYEQFNEFHAETFKNKLNQKVDVALEEKCQKALRAATMAKHNLEKFVVASYNVEQVEKAFAHADSLKDIFEYRAADAVRLQAALESIKKQSHLVPVVVAVLTEVSKTIEGLCPKCGEHLLGESKAKYCKACRTNSWVSVETSVDEHNAMLFRRLEAKNPKSKYEEQLYVEMEWYSYKYKTLDGYEPSDALANLYFNLLDGQDTDGDI